MKYDFLIKTYETELIRAVSVWSEFTEGDHPVRCARTILESKVHFALI